MASVPPSDNAERLEYLYFNLVGQLVQVLTVDGAVVEGLFVSRTDAEGDEEPGIYLNCTRFLASKLHKATEPAAFNAEPQLIHYKNIVLISAISAKLRTEMPGSGNVTGYRGEHDLKTMDWAETVPDDPAMNEQLEDEPHRPGQWDQFATNEKKFGVTSTYREEIYTTTLDKTKFTKDDLSRADRLAREIDQSVTRGAQHRAERRDVADMAESEGELFSDVARKPTRASAKEAKNAAAAAAAGPPAGATRRGAQEEANPPLAPVTAPSAEGNRKPNPAATPFVPSRLIIADYIKTLVDAIRNNPSCFSTQPDWPGEDPHGYYDRDSSSYSQQALMQHPPQQPMPQHAMGNQFMPHHHHHQNMNMPPGAHGNQGMVPGGFAGGMHQGYNGHMPPYMPQQQQNMHNYQDPGMQSTGAPRPPPAQGQRSGGKPQPQQPVSSPVPHQVQQPQQQQQPLQQSAAPSVVPAVDASAGEKQPSKKLRRGGGGAAQRADGGAPESAGAAARRPAR